MLWWSWTHGKVVDTSHDPAHLLCGLSLDVVVNNIIKLSVHMHFATALPSRVLSDKSRNLLGKCRIYEVCSDLTLMTVATTPALAYPCDDKVQCCAACVRFVQIVGHQESAAIYGHLGGQILYLTIPERQR